MSEEAINLDDFQDDISRLLRLPIDLRDKFLRWVRDESIFNGITQDRIEEIDGVGELSTIPRYQEVNEWYKWSLKFIQDNHIHNDLFLMPGENVDTGKFRVIYSNTIPYHPQAFSDGYDPNEETFELKPAKEILFSHDEGFHTMGDIEEHLSKWSINALFDGYAKTGDGLAGGSFNSYVFPSFHKTTSPFGMCLSLIYRSSVYNRVLAKMEELHDADPENNYNPYEPSMYYYTHRCVSRALEQNYTCSGDPGINRVRYLSENGTPEEIAEFASSLRDNGERICDSCLTHIASGNWDKIYLSRHKFAERWLYNLIRDHALWTLEYNSFAITGLDGEPLEFIPNIKWSLSPAGNLLFNKMFGEGSTYFNLSMSKKSNYYITSDYTAGIVGLAPFIQTNYASNSSNDRHAALNVRTIVIDNDNGEELPENIHKRLPRNLHPHVIVRSRKGYQAIWLIEPYYSRKDYSDNKFKNIIELVEKNLKRLLNGDMNFNSLRAVRHRNPFYAEARIALLNDPEYLFNAKDMYHRMVDYGIIRQFSGPERNYGESPEEYRHRIGWVDLRTLSFGPGENVAYRYGIETDNLAGIGSIYEYESGKQYPRGWNRQETSEMASQYPGYIDDYEYGDNDYNAGVPRETVISEVITPRRKATPASIARNEVHQIASLAINRFEEHYNPEIGYRNQTLFDVSYRAAFLLPYAYRNKTNVDELIEAINETFGDDALGDSEVKDMQSRMFDYLISRDFDSNRYVWLSDISNAYSDHKRHDNRKKERISKRYSEDPSSEKWSRNQKLASSISRNRKRRSYNFDSSAFTEYQRYLSVFVARPMLIELAKLLKDSQGMPYVPKLKKFSFDCNWAIKNSKKVLEDMGYESIHDLPMPEFANLRKISNTSTACRNLVMMYGTGFKDIEEIITDEEYGQFLNGEHPFQIAYKNYIAAKAEKTRLNRLEAMRQLEAEQEVYKNEIAEIASNLVAMDEFQKNGVMPSESAMAEYAKRSSTYGADFKAVALLAGAFEEDDESALLSLDKRLSNISVSETTGWGGRLGGSLLGNWDALATHFVVSERKDSTFGTTLCVEIGNFELLIMPENTVQRIYIGRNDNISDILFVNRANFGMSLARLLRQLWREEGISSFKQKMNTTYAIFSTLAERKYARVAAVKSTPGVNSFGQFMNYVFMQTLDDGVSDDFLFQYLPKSVQSQHLINSRIPVSLYQDWNKLRNKVYYFEYPESRSSSMSYRDAVIASRLEIVNHYLELLDEEILETA